MNSKGALSVPLSGTERGVQGSQKYHQTRHPSFEPQQCLQRFTVFPGKGTKAVKDQDLASGRWLITISYLRQRKVRNAEPRGPSDGGHQAVGPES